MHRSRYVKCVNLYFYCEPYIKTFFLEVQQKKSYLDNSQIYKMQAHICTYIILDFIPNLHKFLDYLEVLQCTTGNMMYNHDLGTCFD